MSKEKPFNASDVSQVAELELKARTERETELKDLCAVLNKPEGIRVLRRLIARCGLYRNPFGKDDRETNFQCGQQVIAQGLVADIIEANPAKLAEVLINEGALIEE